ncbi:MAG: 5-(carboxyamino)imidazole ribonucleotide synthase [Isosphaeraceae bacterium]
MTAGIGPSTTLGVIGGGQLGRMFLQAAQRMGFDTAVLSPTADSPAAQIAHHTVVGLSDQLDRVRALAEVAGAVTVEFENVSSAAVRWLGRHRVMRPGWRTLHVSQNRLREKAFLAGHGIPTAPWRPVLDEAGLHQAVEELGLPLILKTAASGYDGKGQVKVDRPESAFAAWAELNRVPCVAEGLVEFEAELSVIVARSEGGQTVRYPVALNRHDRHILDSTVMPAPVGPIIALEARAMATAIVDALGTVGVLCVEMFLTADGRLMVNEMAPRPHNSGHLTIEAAVTCQFEQQVRTLAGLPMGSADLVRPAAMVNLLGDLWARGEPDWQAALRADPGVKLHLYGKKSARAGRKMGHLTVLDDDPQQALLRALSARERLMPPG